MTGNDLINASIELQNPISVDENGMESPPREHGRHRMSGTNVKTNGLTETTASGDGNCNNWFSSSASTTGNIGAGEEIDSTWTDDTAGARDLRLVQASLLASANSREGTGTAGAGTAPPARRTGPPFSRRSAPGRPLTRRQVRRRAPAGAPSGSPSGALRPVAQPLAQGAAAGGAGTWSRGLQT